MRMGYISGVAGLLAVLSVRAQHVDSVPSMLLPDVVVTETYRQRLAKKSALSVEIAGEDFLHKHFTGNLVQAMQNIPGVQAMDIGSGASKPMIRGMGFNRIAVLENGVKQEGQQWGADHGLELDAFNVQAVHVWKGPSSLLYGSDAMGGVIDIAMPVVPAADMLLGDITLLGKSVNGTLGASLLLGVKKGSWYAQARYSEQRFGDYRIPTDTIVYLTQKLPIYGQRLKNTAGIERNGSLFLHYRRQGYRANYTLSNVYQKTGFFPGAHGLPDAARVQEDGDSRNIDLPHNRVNHFKTTTLQQYTWERFVLMGELGFQHNHREERSLFHTHYNTQQPPERDPDKELEFDLYTLSTAVKARFVPSSTWEHTLGWDGQYQRNKIGGYSFLLPAYTRATVGLLWLTSYRPSNVLMVSGGVRYDRGHIDVVAHEDPYLAHYLRTQGYEEAQVDYYSHNSQAVSKHFGDYSFSLGIVWTPDMNRQLKLNIGRSFRLPGANELAANGMHHGTFRHEQGDYHLDSEKGWQLDASYTLYTGRLTFSLSPFVSWFSNYIFLRPMGEWSVLPHAGQVYRYTGAEALFAGAEATAEIRLPYHLHYRLAAEYVYTRNCDEQLPLSFSPPSTLRNILTWQKERYMLAAEWQKIDRQSRVDRNEEATPGANLFHLRGSMGLLLPGSTELEVGITVRNLFDTRYYNHLSFYRKVEIPEPGRTFQLFVKLPLKKLL